MIMEWLLMRRKQHFFVINGKETDRQYLRVGGVTVSYAARYLYLGAWFTDTANINDVITAHETANEIIVNKFSIFCTANTQIPFIYKRKLFDAAVTSSLLYSCESWVINKIKSLEIQYNSLVKCLLAVRKNTSINLCMIESGVPPVMKLIRKRRKSFLRSKLESIHIDHPFWYMIFVDEKHTWLQILI